MSNNNLYVLDSNNYKLIKFDLSTPNTPHQTLKINLAGNPDRVKVLEDLVYFSAPEGLIKFNLLKDSIASYVRSTAHYNLGITNNNLLYAIKKEDHKLYEYSIGMYNLNSKTNRVINDKEFFYSAGENLYQIALKKTQGEFGQSQIIASYTYPNNDSETNIQNIAIDGEYSFVDVTGNKDIAGLKIYKIEKNLDGYKSKLIKKYTPDFMGSYHCDMVVDGNYLHIATFNKDKGEYQIIKLAELSKINIATDNKKASKANFMQFSTNGSMRNYIDSEREFKDIIKSVTWDTSDHNIAEINTQGTMFAYREGTVDIIATAFDGERKTTSKIPVIIADNTNKNKLDNNKIKEFLPMFLKKASGDASEEDLHVIYAVLAKSHKLDHESEKTKKGIMLDIENRKIKKNILNEIIEKKDKIKDKTFIEDVIELRDEL